MSSADLLLHVVSANEEYLQRQKSIEAVDTVLAEIGAEDIPRLLVYNKIDLVEDLQPHVDVDQASGLPVKVWLSAKTGEGFDLLRESIGEVIVD